jgi:hypothetical protein
MAEVFAGFVCGFFLSAVSAPLFAAALLRMRATSPALARMLPAGVNAVSVTMVLHFALVFFWTGIGLIFGLVLLAMAGGRAALGTANAPYTLFVFSIVLALSAPVALLIVPWRRGIVLGGLAAFLVFGYLMPYMAEWSKFD